MRKSKTLNTRNMSAKKIFLLSSALLLFWSPSAQAWWGKYGSKAEADMARREWVEKGGEYKKTWTVRSTRRVRDRNPKPVEIPPMPKPWKPETYPWLISGEQWDAYEKNCWKEVMSAETVYRMCGHVLNANNRPRPKYPKWRYNMLVRERELAIERSKEPQHKTEFYDEEKFTMVRLRNCFNEKETRQYVCTQKRGLRKGGVYTSERVDNASTEYKYFKY